MPYLKSKFQADIFTSMQFTKTGNLLLYLSIATSTSIILLLFSIAISVGQFIPWISTLLFLILLFILLPWFMGFEEKDYSIKGTMLLITYLTITYFLWSLRFIQFQYLFIVKRAS